MYDFLAYSFHKLEIIFKNLCLEEYAFRFYIWYVLLEELFLPRHPHFDHDGGTGGI